MDLRIKLQLQKEANVLKKTIAETTAIRERIALQKQWHEIIKELKGSSKPVTDNLDDKGNSITEEANKSAESDVSEQQKPTDAQKEAGNYKKGNITLYGMDIVIENPKGSTRTGTGEDGTQWSTTMHHHYGEIKETKGNDGDRIDCFIGELKDAETIFVIDQINPKSRTFDEHKVMIGFDSLANARKAYLKNYEDNWNGLGAIKALSIEAFKSWVFSGTKNKPVKYIEGHLPEKVNTSLPEINPVDYEKMSRTVVKEEAISLNTIGYSLDVVRDVLAHWLKVNVPA